MRGAGRLSLNVALTGGGATTFMKENAAVPLSDRAPSRKRKQFGKCPNSYCMFNPRKNVLPIEDGCPLMTAFRDCLRDCC